MQISHFFIGALFCYGMYTLQRPGFLLDRLPVLWKKLPKKLHEPLYSCGVCVSSFWGAVYLLIIISNILILNYISYLVAFCGFCAILDRAVKHFEYTYKYNPVPELSNYSYLETYTYRDDMIFAFLPPPHIPIVEIGGYTQRIAEKYYQKYAHYEKKEQSDVLKAYFSEPCFFVIKGIAFEGNFDALLNLLEKSCGFIIEGSLSGTSKTQINWILDRFSKDIIKMPYTVNISKDSPDHCGGNVNNRIIIIKKHE